MVIKRDGDYYMALLDCYKALDFDKMHMKSHFRLVRCLYELKWCSEAKECLEIFIKRFPEYANSNACDALVKDIKTKLDETFKLANKTSVSTNADEATTTSEESENEYDQFLTTKKKKRNNTDSNSDDTSSTKSNESEQDEKLKLMRRNYLKAKIKAVDLKKRFCGHCNVSTDIKEACFLGENYISAGSDDGSFFIWDRETTNVVRLGSSKHASILGQMSGDQN